MESDEKLLIDCYIKVQVLEKILIDKNIISKEEYSKLLNDVTLNLSKIILEKTLNINLNKEK